MAKLPSFQFYPGDWMKDPAVSLCSPATRGIWFDALCLMHERNRSGVLSGTTEQLARALRCTPAELVFAVDELDQTHAANVSQNGNGAITLINRRMHSEFNEREDARKRQHTTRQNKPCHANVTEEDNQQNQVDTGSVTGLSQDCHKNVTPYSSSSTSIHATSIKNIEVAGSHSQASDSPSSQDFSQTPIPVEPKLPSAETKPTPKSVGTKGKAKCPTICDDDFLQSLQQNPAYNGLNVNHVFLKMKAWCDLRGKEPTRRRFVDWLNREDKPMQLSPSPPQPSKPKPPFPTLDQCQTEILANVEAWKQNRQNSPRWTSPLVSEIGGSVGITVYGCFNPDMPETERKTKIQKAYLEVKTKYEAKHSQPRLVAAS